MKEYNHLTLEKKWREKWEKDKLYKTSDNTSKEKCYVLDMFPYPSGVGLHVGHPKGYVATDIYSRMKRMRGFNVLHPMGWDAFGLPAEQFALKNKVHPKKLTEESVQNYKKQLENIGLDYDWDREINTTDPVYYKWTQWIFIQLFKAGLAYESNEPINWCDDCKTGLANEDLEDGKCERCGAPIVKKPIRQWILRITDYADKLLEGLDDLDWTESIKQSQRNWIGRSEGINIKNKVKDSDIEFEVYDSIPQTEFAQTYTIIAPEHPLLKELVSGTEYEKDVLAFAEHVAKKKLENRFDVEKDLEGIFTGRYVENYLGMGRDLPIWVASYAVYDYGTGIVNCSAHDQRDFNFAKKYDIPLHPVLFPEDPEHAEKVRNLEVFYREPNGVLAEPEQFKGRKWYEVREDMIDWTVEQGFATRKVNYKLRDWVFARQRYWGEPIPLIHCDDCGVVAVPESDLPVELPEVESYEPTGTGESPLADITDWVKTTCPECGGEGRRETNTMPQWAGSSWYYLRYIDPDNTEVFVDKEKEKYWSPVDFYVGGAEHATRHLIYARFWHRFLYDQGHVSYKEPFKRLQNVGLIVGEDGRKMGKRYGNVVDPNEIVALYGADTFRTFEMFMGPFDGSIAWSSESIIGVRRFIEKVWRLQEKVSETETSVEVETLLHKTVKKVGEDIESFDFNTAISSLMILSNLLEKQETVSKEVFEVFVKLLAPFAPHVTEELWSDLGNGNSIHTSEWPEFDESKLVDAEVVIAIQVNGKVRDEVKVSQGATEEDVLQVARELDTVSKWLEGKEEKKIIFVEDKILNIVVG
jgi:leucyl-tRNA synthetase